MAGKAVLTIDVTADTSSAVSGLDKVSAATKSYGDAADTASKKSRDVAGTVEGVGGASGQATQGLRDLGGAMAQMGGTVGAMGTAMETSAVAFEALDGAATLYSVAQTACSGAVGFFTTVLNAMKVAILTNPIFIIAAIVIAIGAAFVIAYMKCETFRNIVDGAFDAILGVIKAVYNWVKDNWPLLLAILTGPFGLMVAGIIRYRDDIWDAIKAVYNWIKDAWSNIANWLTAPFKTAWDTISGIIDKIKSGIQWVLDKIPTIKFPSLPDWIPFVGSNAVLGGVPAMAGVARAPAVAAMRGPAGMATSSGGGITINVTGALDPDAVARQIARVLRARDRRVGGVGAR